MGERERERGKYDPGEKGRRRERECSVFYLVSACATLHPNFELAQWPRPTDHRAGNMLVK
jgi:hypothetical protein